MPENKGEIGENTPQEGETPFFVLLQSDNLISHVSVETSELLDPPHNAGKDGSYARLIVSVTLSPYYVNMFNLGFA